MYIVYGLKLAKREPWINPKTGEIIDDGINRDIVLCKSNNKELCDFFYKSIKSRIHGKSWKIWQKNLT